MVVGFENQMSENIHTQGFVLVRHSRDAVRASFSHRECRGGRARDANPRKLSTEYLT